MEEDVAVGVRIFAFIERDDDSSDHQFSSWNKAVHIVAQAGSKGRHPYILRIGDLFIFRRALHRHNVSFVFSPNFRVIRICFSVVFRFAVRSEQSNKTESLRCLNRSHTFPLEMFDDKTFGVDNFLRVRRQNGRDGSSVFDCRLCGTDDDLFGDEGTGGVMNQNDTVRNFFSGFFKRDFYGSLPRRPSADEDGFCFLQKCFDFRIRIKRIACKSAVFIGRNCDNERRAVERF